MTLRRLFPLAIALSGAVVLFLIINDRLGRSSPRGKTATADSVAQAEKHLPVEFRQRLRDRAMLDICQEQLHAVDQELFPSALQLPPARAVDPSFIKTREHSVSPNILAYRQALPDNKPPMLGFRAPVLEHREETWPATVEIGRFDRTSLQAAGMIATQLPADGVVQTFARALEILGSAYWSKSPSDLAPVLRRLGFPTDLLACFHSSQIEPGSSEKFIGWMTARLLSGATVQSLQPELGRIQFRFQPALPGFLVASESGEDGLGMLRLQFGGGYRDGIIPGGTMDLARQLINALPDVDFLISVPRHVFEAFESTCRNYTSPVRAGQLTLVREQLSHSAWAQDNGKAGLKRTEQGAVWATLIPRYASKGEGDSTFLPGDSFLVDGLPSAGHVVAQSHLLFQGGNLYPVREPSTGERILLLGEAEVYRNTALGLTKEQVMEAFRMEFGVDRCVVLPAVSFHVDFDLSVRSHDNRLIAFVNDPLLAARLVVERGAVALGQHGLIPSASLEIVRAAIKASDDRVAFETLAPLVYRHLTPNGQFPVAFARYFKVAAVDAPTENMRCFLVALELLGSHFLVGASAPKSATMRDYMAALQRLMEASTRQLAQLQKLKCQIVPLPSMPDLTPSLNYLNGVHDRSRFLMPVYGGFYREVDSAALKIVGDTLGRGVTIVPFISGETQRQHGGVHCAAAAYPRL